MPRFSRRNADFGTYVRNFETRFRGHKSAAGWASQPDESTRRGHAKIVEVTTDKSTSFAGLAGLLDEWPPEWEEDPIQIAIGSGSASLTKATYKRTVTEDFDYEEEDGQLSREGTIEDVTERTAESLQALEDDDQGDAHLSSRRDAKLLVFPTRRPAMARHERDLAKERHWRDVLARQAASGLNVRAFCTRERIAESAFHFWRRTIRERDGEVKHASPAPGFVPAIIASDVACEAFSLELAGGHVLRMPRTSVEKLADLIAALDRMLIESAL